MIRSLSARKIGNDMKVRDRVNSLGDWNIKMNGDEILSSRYLKYTNKEQVERVMDAEIYTEITGIDKTTLVILEIPDPGRNNI